MQFTFDPRPDHLRVIISGPVDMLEGKAGIDELFRKCMAGQFSKVLIDARGVPGEVSLGQRFALAEYLAAHYPRPIRISLLVSTSLAQITRMFEDTANNRGVLICTTDSEEVARAYLLLESQL